MKWVTKNKTIDLLLILFPWVFFIPLVETITESSPYYIALAFVALAFLDSGHVYTTFWRTITGKATNKSHYILIIIALFLGISAWMYFQIPYFWSFIVYATLFHHIRQYFGMLKWYQKINKTFDKIQDYALYAFAILPVLAFHTVSSTTGEYYTPNDLFTFQSPTLFWIITSVYVLTILAWIIYEISHFTSRRVPSILAVVAPLLLYLYAFYFADTFFQLIVTLVIGHAIPYITIMSLSLEKVKMHQHIITASIIIVLTALIAGTFELWIEESIYAFGFIYESTSLTLLSSAIVALFMTPLLAHFIIDGYIWKGKHPDAKIIYK